MGADIVLRHKSLEMGIDSRLGGACTYLNYSRAHGLPFLDVLRQLPADSQVAFESACFAMLPFSNRLMDSRLRMAAGTDLKLPPNSERVAVPVHGVGWMNAWEVTAKESNQVTLAYRHAANAHWPFPMVCTQTIGVFDGCVRFEASVCNTGQSSMPAGLGFHPRFALTPDAVVTLGVQSVWLQDSLGCPTHSVDVTDHDSFDFSVPRSAQSVALNHCFAGWSGQATLDFPGHQLSVCLSASPELRHLVVYRLPGQAWLCIEPVSHAIGALSLDALASKLHGGRVLQPGECLSGSIEISLNDYSVTQ